MVKWEVRVYTRNWSGFVGEQKKRSGLTRSVKYQPKNSKVLVRFA